MSMASVSFRSGRMRCRRVEDTRKCGGRRKHHRCSDFSTEFPEKPVKPLSGLRQSAKEQQPVGALARKRRGSGQGRRPGNHRHLESGRPCGRDQQSAGIIDDRHTAVRYKSDIVPRIEPVEEDGDFFFVACVTGDGCSNPVMVEERSSGQRSFCRHNGNPSEDGPGTKGQVVRCIRSASRR